MSEWFEGASIARMTQKSDRTSSYENLCLTILRDGETDREVWDQ